MGKKDLSYPRGDRIGIHMEKRNENRGAKTSKGKQKG